MIDGGLVQTLVVGHLWQSVALAAVLACALILGRRMRGATRYNLAVIALAASVILPLAAFIPGESIARAVLDRLDAPPTIAEKQAQAPATGPSLIEQAAAENGVPMWQVQLASDIFNAATENSAVPASEVGLGKAAVENGAPAWAIDLAGNAMRKAAQPTPAPEPPKPFFTFPEIKLPDLGLPDLTLPLAMVWIAGALLLLSRTARDLIAVERLVAASRPANLPDKLKARMQGVRVAVSPDAPGPMAAGLLRPCIVLPENIALTSPGMAALLEHERAHIERRDMAVALLQRVMLALLWWSPALHWISRRIDEERELACDDAAVDRTGNAKALARSLTVEAENQLWARAPRLAVGAIGPRSQAGRRIKRLIEAAKGAPYAKYSGRLAFAGLALAVAVAAMVTPRFNADAQQPGALPPVDQSLDGAPVDLVSPRDQVSRPDAADWADLRDLSDSDRQELALLGDDLATLMDDLGHELEISLAGLSPELQAELHGLSAEMASLGVEISSIVSQEVLRELPQIMDEVRRELEAAGIDIDDHEQWREHSEEIREALEEAREELREALGPEMREEIRAALEEARAEVAAHRDEIRVALQESRTGMEIARQAMAQAREEIAAARARGDFDDFEKFQNQNWHFDFDLDEETIEKLRESGLDMRDAAEKARLDRIKLDGGPGSSPLMYAVMAGDDDAVRAEIRAGADPNAAAPGRSSPLMHAVMSGNDDIAKLLIDAGADVNRTAPGRGGPLVHAVMSGNDGMVRMLLKAGADANKGAPGAQAPLFVAVQAGNDDIVRLLLNAGADPNAKAPGASTVLVHAVQAGNEDIVRLLVGKGADVNASSRFGSPLRIAEMSGDRSLIDYLRSKGAISKPKSPN